MLEIAREAHRRRITFRRAVSNHLEVRKRLSPRELDAAFDYRRSVGLSAYFVDQVVAAHRVERRKRKRMR